MTYQFPANGTLAANTSLYPASKSSAFIARYGFNPYGEFYRNLSNSNQNLLLTDGFGNTIDQVNYYDSLPWPTSADGGGSYLQLISTDLDNNIASSWVASNALSLTEQEIESQIDIYPNPTKDFITINSKNPVSKIEIFDMEGRLIQTITTKYEINQLDFSRFSIGIYMLKIEINGISVTRKIIKK